MEEKKMKSNKVSVVIAGKKFDIGKGDTIYNQISDTYSDYHKGQLIKQIKDHYVDVKFDGTYEEYLEHALYTSWQKLDRIMLDNTTLIFKPIKNGKEE